MFSWIKKLVVQLKIKKKYLLIFFPLLAMIPVGYSQYNVVTLNPRNLYNYDIVVYGGTPSGVMAAVAASREGAKVAVIEPGSHIGGMITGGLSSSDVNRPDKIGGLANEFFQRAGEYYGIEIIYSFEPHVAEKVMLDMINEAGVDVYYNHSIKLKEGVKKDGTKLIKLVTENDDNFNAKVYIDCSYEGDLMAGADVSYTYGREGTEEYSESLAGVRPFVPAHNFIYPLKADTSETLLEVASEPAGNIGEADKKIPAYNYRLCLTDDLSNQVSFVKPLNYDPERYEVLLDWITLLKKSERSRKLSVSNILCLEKLPRRKADVNNSGPFSSDYIGHSWNYAESDYETREYIADEHKEYLQGLLYFVANDLRVPYDMRAEINKWGYAKDEFIDNDNWPYQLYIREGRRMIGDFVMTQKDLQNSTVKSDSIGMASYQIDSHHTQRYIGRDGLVRNEGDIQVFVYPYQIPYRIMLPRKDEATNLIVPVCMSASHVAYSSLRMEPQYMIMGEAAGVSAKEAIDNDLSVQDISVDKLTHRLGELGAVLK